MTFLAVDLLAFVRDGGELEMPAGLAKRLVANGWTLPGRTPEEVEEIFRTTLTDLALGAKPGSEEWDDIDPAAVIALIALGVTH